MEYLLWHKLLHQIHQIENTPRIKVIHLLQELDDDAKTSALNIVIKDKFMPIRRKALQILLRNDDNSLAKQFLFDKHASIRIIAIAHLNKSNVDIQEIYCNSLTANNIFFIRCALWGVAELNKSIPLIKDHLTSNYPSIRKQAINSFVKLVDSSNAKTELTNCLLDNSPAVCKESARLIDNLKISFIDDELLQIIDKSKFIHTAISCIYISKRLSKWERLIFLISLFEEQYLIKLDDIKLIQLSLKHWNMNFNRSFSQPNKQQLKVLEQKYNKFSKLLNTDEYKGIVFSLKSYGIYSNS